MTCVVIRLHMRCLVDRQNGKYRGTEKENLIKLLDTFQRHGKRKLD